MSIKNYIVVKVDNQIIAALIRSCHFMPLTPYDEAIQGINMHVMALVVTSWITELRRIQGNVPQN